MTHTGGGEVEIRDLRGRCGSLDGGIELGIDRRDVGHLAGRDRERSAGSRRAENLGITEHNHPSVGSLGLHRLVCGDQCWFQALESLSRLGEALNRARLAARCGCVLRWRGAPRRTGPSPPVNTVGDESHAGQDATGARRPGQMDLLGPNQTCSTKATCFTSTLSPH